MKKAYIVLFLSFFVLALLGIVNAQQTAPQFEAILAQYDFPVIGRNFAVAVFMLGHVIFPNLAIGGPLIALISEFIAVRKKSPEWDRFAKTAAKFAVVMFSIGSTFAVAGVVLFSWLFPNFWILGLNLFGWPLVLEGLTFFFAIATLYSYYYLWDRWHNKRTQHMILGLAAVWFAHQAMFLINGVAAIMLTPPETLVPVLQKLLAGEITQLPALSLPLSLAILYLPNPSYWPLNAHRILANISVAGLLLAGFYALYYIKRKEKYFDFAVSRALIFGIVPILFQPLVGLWYVLVIRDYQTKFGAALPSFYEKLTGIKESAYTPFTTIMVTKQWLIVAVSIIYALMFILFAVYVLSKVKEEQKKIIYTLAGISFVALILLGARVSGMGEDYLAFILLIASGIFLIKILKENITNTAKNFGMYAIVLLQFFTVLIVYYMGFVREVARKPWLVPGLIRTQDLAPGMTLKKTAYVSSAVEVTGIVLLTAVVFYIFIIIGLKLTNIPGVSSPMEIEVVEKKTSTKTALSAD